MKAYQFGFYLLLTICICPLDFIRAQSAGESYADTGPDLRTTPAEISGHIKGVLLPSDQELYVVGLGNEFQTIINNDWSYSIPFGITAPAKFGFRFDKDCLHSTNVGDIIRIINHILQKKEITSGQNLIAADVNIDGKISVSDIVEIRRLILGYTDRFTSGYSWRFIDATFPLYANNWNLAPDYIEVRPGGTSNADFVAIKLGDADPMFFTGDDEIATRNTLPQAMLISERQNSGRTEVNIQAGNIVSLEGLQISLLTDPSLQLTYIHPALNELCYFISETGDRINILLTGENLKEFVKGETLFSFISHQGHNSELQPLIHINPSFENIAFDLQGQPYTPEIKSEIIISDHFAVSPNPFKNETKITFDSGTEDELRLIITDAGGLVLTDKKIAVIKGFNSYTISKENLNAPSGLFFYQLSGPNTFTSGKLIMLD